MSANPSQAPAASGVPRAAQAVMPALSEAARRTGVTFDALFHTARLESGFNPDARARTSTATGLFQFIDSTWLDTLSKHGARHGLTPVSRADAMELRRDPWAASLMAAEHMAENGTQLEARLGRPASSVDLYLAHFLGVGGAVRFLEQLAEAPESAAAGLLPAAARANRTIFFSGGNPRSVREVHELFARKLGTAPVGAPQDRSAEQPSAPPAGLAILAGLPAGTRLATGLSLAERTLPGDQPAVPEALQAAQAARLAYLLLADMGG